MFNYQKLKKITESLVEFYSGLKTLKGKEKKDAVIEGVIQIQQKRFNIKFIPDAIEVMVLKWILNLLVEEVYAKIKNRNS